MSGCSASLCIFFTCFHTSNRGPPNRVNNIFVFSFYFFFVIWIHLPFKTLLLLKQIALLPLKLVKAKKKQIVLSKTISFRWLGNAISKKKSINVFHRFSISCVLLPIMIVYLSDRTIHIEMKKLFLYMTKTKNNKQKELCQMKNKMSTWHHNLKYN